MFQKLPGSSSATALVTASTSATPVKGSAMSVATLSVVVAVAEVPVSAKGCDSVDLPLFAVMDFFPDLVDLVDLRPPWLFRPPSACPAAFAVVFDDGLEPFDFCFEIGLDWPLPSVYSVGTDFIFLGGSWMAVSHMPHSPR